MRAPTRPKAGERLLLLQSGTVVEAEIRWVLECQRASLDAKLGRRAIAPEDCVARYRIGIRAR